MTKNKKLKSQLTIGAADLPPAVRVFWETAPKQFKLAALVSSLSCYCALGTRLRAKYVYDLDPHALLVQVLVLGEPGSGKSFTRPIVKQLMGPLKIKDKEQKRIEQAYQDLKKTAAKNKQLPEEPITVARMVNTITKCKLVKRADMMVRKYGEPLSFFFYSEELATMTESNRRAFADLNTMDRLAYDLGAEYSSDTLSDASYNADVDVIYCSLFCGTDNALNEYINKRAIEGGNCTRKVVVRIDDDLMGEDAPVFRKQTAEECDLVKGMVDKLMRETYTDDDLLQPVHEMKVEWLDRVVKKWCDDQRQMVLNTGSRALNCFYKRASVSAWRMSCMCYHLWGEDEQYKSKVIKVYRYLANKILEGLMDKWGKKYEEIHKHDDDGEGYGRVVLLDQLPKEFTRDQLRDTLDRLGMSTSPRIILCKWKKNKKIYQSAESKDLFVKMF